MANLGSRRKTKEEAAANVSDELPLFFKKPVVIERSRHAAATIHDVKHFAVARATNAIPLSGAEFMEASRCFPIIFTNTDQPMPMACVGLEKENYFVNEKGEWADGHYIPAYVRQYPFVLFEQPVEGSEDQKQLYLCVDELSLHFNNNREQGGNELFTADGAPSAFSQKALEFCQAVLQQHRITRNFCADLQKHKLLAPYQTKLDLNSGKSITLADFLAIDEKALNALSSDVFLEFREKGWLPLIYLVLFSSANWRTLANMAGK